MSNKVYVKKVGESGGGELGTFYFEFVDNYISKQIEVHGTASFFLDENHPEEGEHM